jgi:DNA polymerase III delta prime subunit
MVQGVKHELVSGSFMSQFTGTDCFKRSVPKTKAAKRKCDPSPLLQSKSKPPQQCNPIPYIPSKPSVKHQDNHPAESKHEAKRQCNPIPYKSAFVNTNIVSQPRKPPQKLPVLPTLGNSLITSFFQDHYIGRDDVLRQIHSFVTDRLTHPLTDQNVKVALALQGPTGCGKLTAIRHVCRTAKLRLQVLSLNDFCHSSNLTFEEQLFSKMSSYNVIDRVRPIVVIQGFDGWDVVQQRKIIKLLQEFEGNAPRGPKRKKGSKNIKALHVTVQDQIHLVQSKRMCNPIILTLSDQYFRERKNVMKVSLLVKTSPPPENTMVTMGSRLAKRMQFQITETQLREIALSSNGDLRHMMNQLEFWRGTTDGRIAAMSTKNITVMGYFDLVSYYFSPPRRDLRRQKLQHQALTAIVQENKKLVQKNSFGGDLSVYEDTAGMFSPYQQKEQAMHHDMLQPAIYTNYPIAFKNQIHNLCESAELLSMWDTVSGDNGYTPSWVYEVAHLTLQTKPKKCGQFEFPKPQFFQLSSITHKNAEYLDLSAQSYARDRGFFENRLDVRNRIGAWTLEVDHSFLHPRMSEYSLQDSRTMRGRFNL